METILFQGDSITDAGRDRENFYDLGKGYPVLIAGRLGMDHPGQYRFLNRGVSGDRVVDLYARMKRDILNLKPDVLSILVGVNDVWHELDLENGVSADKFKRVYRMLLAEILEALPNTKILLLESYVLDGSATHKYIDVFTSEVAARGKAVRELAEEFGLPFLPLQKPLEELTRFAPGTTGWQTASIPIFPSTSILPINGSWQQGTFFTERMAACGLKKPKSRQRRSPVPSIWYSPPLC